MATQKDLLRTAILSGAAEGMSTSGELVTVSTPSSLPSGGFSTVSPIRGYCGVRVLSTRGSKDGGSPWLAIKTKAVEENINASWFTGGGAFTTIPVSKGQIVTVTGAEIKMDVLRFIKVIVGGHKRYLPSLSRSRFGGAPWLRLKTASETLPRRGAGSHSLPINASLSKPSRPHLRRVTENTTRHQTAFSSSGWRPLGHAQNYAKMAENNSCLQTPIQLGQKRRYPVFEVEGLSTRFGAPASSKESSTSFLLSVASNNARIEVAA